MIRAAEDSSITHCPRCGADVGGPEAQQCPCCGTQLGNAPLRMSVTPAEMRPRPSVSASATTSAKAPDSVRQHPEYQQWMQDAPTGLVHVLGLGAIAVMGLVFTALALTGAFDRKFDNTLGVALFTCVDAAVAGFGIWRLWRYYQAPRRNRVASVAAERERMTRTKHGWRTRHYATFQFEDGSREEFPVSSSLASQLTRGDRGVAITRDCFLLAFHNAGRG